MNQTRDYRALEREYVEGTMSLRALCRDHGITNSSTVNVQSKRLKWREKRADYQEEVSKRMIVGSAARTVDREIREMQVRDDIVETIHEAVLKMRDDMKATTWRKRTVNAEGVHEWVEEPVVRYGPNDLVKLIDRLQVMFGRPATINEERSKSVDISITSDRLPGGTTLAELLAATSGADILPTGGAALPRLTDGGGG